MIDPVPQDRFQVYLAPFVVVVVPAARAAAINTLLVSRAHAPIQALSMPDRGVVSMSMLCDKSGRRAKVPGRHLFSAVMTP